MFIGLRTSSSSLIDTYLNIGNVIFLFSWYGVHKLLCEDKNSLSFGVGLMIFKFNDLNKYYKYSVLSIYMPTGVDAPRSCGGYWSTAR